MEGILLIYLKNLQYLLKHKYYVMRECFKRQEYVLGITHDLSKIFPWEFIPYAHSFYGDHWDWNVIKYMSPTFPYKWTKQGVEESFDKAWLYHQKLNKHHWQFWLLQKDDGTAIPMEIPLKYRKELISDWIGAGIAINGHNEVFDWYQNNKDKIILAPFTRKWIEEELKQYK
jgi:hypothetical protein